MEARTHAHPDAKGDRGDPRQGVLRRPGPAFDTAFFRAAGYRAQESSATTRRGVERDEYILSLGCFTAPMLEEFEWFPSRRAATTRLSILWRRGKIDSYGIDRTYAPGFRPEIWCPYSPHSRSMPHEQLGTYVQLHYPEGEWMRGYRFGPPYPDAKVKFTEWMYVEFDNATEGPKMWRERVKAYAGVEETVLVVAREQARINKLIEWSKKSPKVEGSMDFETALFATLDDIHQDRWGRIWKGIGGTMHRLLPPPRGLPDFLRGGPLREAAWKQSEKAS